MGARTTSDSFFAWLLLGFFALVLIIILVAVSGFRIAFNTTEGEKVGQVFSVNKQGFISKTWEAELIRGGMNSGSGSFGIKPFDFTVPTDKLAALVHQYAESRTEVIVKYRQPHVYWYWQTENDGVFLVDIRPAN